MKIETQTTGPTITLVTPSDISFPFAITNEIREANKAHTDYVSAGHEWLLKNDPECQHETIFLDRIVTAIERAAHDHFGDDEDAYEEFCEEYQLRDGDASVWYDIVQNVSGA
jgi:hypothetical protein